MSNVQNDFSRQVNILDVESFKIPIHIIGAGATGSWLAFSLAKMGIQNITVYDFDEIGMHNLPNQMFGLSDIGKNKAVAIAQQIRKFTGYNIKARNMKVDGSQPMQGIVFMLTDTMSSRRNIYDIAIKNNPFIELYIETRMDLRGGRVYAIDPKQKHLKTEYEKTLYSDDEAEVSACGVSQTVLATGLGIVSNAIWKMLNFVNGEIYDNETIIDYSNGIVFNTIWHDEDEPKVFRIIKEDIIIKCNSHNESNKVLKELEMQNFIWGMGEKPTEKDFWKSSMEIDDESICYHIDARNKKITYGRVRRNSKTSSGEDVTEFKDIFI